MATSFRTYFSAFALFLSMMTIPGFSRADGGTGGEIPPAAGVSRAARGAGETHPPATIPCPLPEKAQGGKNHRLILKAPITRWDEAIPLGNGITGGLFWGEGNELRLSLDRGDLWDLRVPEPYEKSGWNYELLKKLARRKNEKDLNGLFDTPYRGFKYPTKLPGARLVVTLGPEARIASFGLDMGSALGWADLGKGRRAECFFSAVEPVALLRIPGPPVEMDLKANRAVAQLGYPPAEAAREGDTVRLAQQAALGFSYCILARKKVLDGETLIAITLTTCGKDADPAARARKRADEALRAGWEASRAPHLEWWRKFRSVSSVTVPDEAIQRQYDLAEYFYGAASRRGAPPMPLQGVWTADSGGLPPWKGDYHNDLNTQLTYWAYLEAGHFDQGACFLDFLWSLKSVHEKFARHFYGVEGLVIPGVMALDGKPMGGWAQYSFSPITGVWAALAFYDHWRYTMDRAFLENRAFPYLLESAKAALGLLEPDSSGKLKLPLSTSPEIHGNSRKAWLTPNSNYDLALMRHLFIAVSDMAGELGKQKESRRWREVLAKMDDLAVEGKEGPLMISPDEKLSGSHRHHSNLMAIHPLGDLNIDGTDRDRAVIAASLDKLRRLGTRAWCGYSFSWAAAMSARAGRAEDALDYLQKFVHAFVLRNGFHANGDQTRSGLSGFTYRPFTLEGDFAAAQAVHEMLLQSWPPDRLADSTPVIRIFPAVPWRWHDASFERLRAEGGYIVSARWENNAATWFRVEATRDGTLRIRNAFGGRKPRFTGGAPRLEGRDFVFDVRTGDAIEAVLEKPAAIPPEPPGAAGPFRLPRK